MDGGNIEFSDIQLRKEERVTLKKLVAWIIGLRNKLNSAEKSGQTRMKGKIMKLVKIGKMGHKVQEFAVGDNETIESILRMTGTVLGSGQELLRNGVVTTALNNGYIENNDFILIQNKPDMYINIGIGNVGSSLIHWQARKGQTIAGVLRDAGFSYNIATQDLWGHREGVITGTLLNPSYILVDKDIIVIENKKTLFNKILKIISENCEDENGEDEEATKLICGMLSKDYHLES
jgi:hypothetical protein